MPLKDNEIIAIGCMREKRNYFYNLNLNKITDNKTFWKTVKSFLSNKGDFP